MKIQINYDDNELWCVESKERIEIGEKYVEIMEGDIKKTYKLDSAPSDDEQDDLYIGENRD